jgi:hypothetical protein
MNVVGSSEYIVAVAGVIEMGPVVAAEPETAPLPQETNIGIESKESSVGMTLPTT